MKDLDWKRLTEGFERRVNKVPDSFKKVKKVLQQSHTWANHDILDSFNVANKDSIALAELVGTSEGAGAAADVYCKQIKCLKLNQLVLLLLNMNLIPFSLMSSEDLKSNRRTVAPSPRL